MKKNYIISSNIFGNGGQALITRHVIKALREDGRELEIIDIKPGGKYSLIKYIRLYFLIFIKNNIESIYFTPTRNPILLVKDLPIYFLSLFDIKVIAHVHGNDLSKILNIRTLGQILRKLYRYKIKCLIPSKYLADKYREEFGINCIVVENFLREEDTKILCKNRGLAYSNIIWNSNLLKSKGVLDFFICIDKVVDKVKYKDIDIKIYGALDEAQPNNEVDHSLKKLVREKERVFYYGEVTRSETLSEMNSKSIVCLFSRSECQPLAIIDAMVAGSFIMVYDYPEMLDLLRDYPKALLICKDTSSLVDDFEERIEATFSYEREIDTKSISDRFSEKVFVLNILMIFDDRF